MKLFAEKTRNAHLGTAGALGYDNQTCAIAARAQEPDSRPDFCTQGLPESRLK
jgi:hypothetical protein